MNRKDKANYLIFIKEWKHLEGGNFTKEEIEIIKNAKPLTHEELLIKVKEAIKALTT